MENSSHYQKRVIDKIYGKYGKGPLESLEDLCKFHLDHLHNEEDRLIILHFKKDVDRNLSLHLASDKRFNNFDSFKENYLEETHNYVSNKCDELGWTGVDGIADLTKAYVGELIDQQKSIFDSSVKVYINIKDEEPLDVIQFVSDLFLDKHKFNARLKIDYLNEELNQLKGISKPIEAFEDKLGFKKERNTKHITIRNKRILPLLTQLNLKVEFLREDCSPEDFITVLTVASEKGIHLNIDNRNFHYLLTKIKEYFFNFTITAVGKTNKIHSKRGTLLKANNLINAKGDYPSLKDSIDEVFKNFK